MSASRSKLYRLTNLFQVASARLRILRDIFLGGNNSALPHILRLRRFLTLSSDNVKRIIPLGTILARFQVRYEVRDNEVRCEPWPGIIRALSPKFTSEELDFLAALCLLGKYVARITPLADYHFLVTDVEGVKWMVRCASPVFLESDALFGPLLSCYQEPREYAWFAHALHKGDTFVDVGANVEGYSVRACRLGARVIALEPDPDNYHVLKRNLELNQCTYAHVLNIAAGGQEEVHALYDSGNGAPVGYSLLQATKPSKVKCSVDVRPLDVAIPPFLDHDWVKLLKIDVEGVELEVIQGARDLLTRTRYVIVEVLPSTESRLLETLDLVKPLGFKLVDKVCRLSLYCDLFLVNSKAS